MSTAITPASFGPPGSTAVTTMSKRGGPAGADPDDDDFYDEKQGGGAGGAGGGEAKAADPKAIWEDEEVDEEGDVDDGRARPEFDILYKQHVGSEDMFLGLGQMTPSTNDCNYMVVKVRARRGEAKRGGSAARVLYV